MEEASQQQHVGSEWGQQFVDNFFQPSATSDGMMGTPMYYEGAEANVGTYGAPITSTGMIATSSASPMFYGAYPTQNTGVMDSYAGAGAYTSVPFSAYQAPQMSTTYTSPMYTAPGGTTYTTLPQSQMHPMYSAYSPATIGNQVYALPPTTKQSSHKKKKRGFCC